MNRYQSNIIDMATLVSTYMAKNKTLWQTNTAITDTMTEVDADLAAVSGVDVKQAVPVTGPAADKAVARHALEEEIMVVANQIAALAAKNNDATTEAQADLTLSKLDALKEEDLTATAARIGALATANLPALAAYGITAADVTKLTGLSTAFSATKTGPRAAVVNRKGQTELLPPAVSNLLSTLRRRLDRQVSVFKAGNPEFYAGYLAARVIVNRGNPAKKNTPTPPATTPAK
jgi:hypothetical protein